MPAAMLLVVALLWQADLQKVFYTLQSVSLPVLAAACLLQCITIFLIALQWWMIARKMNLPLSPGQALHINLSGAFVESITPAVKLGGEVGKVFILRSYPGMNTPRAAALVGLQKIFSLAPFIGLNLFSLFGLLLLTRFSGHLLLWIAGGFAVLSMVSGLLVWLVFSPGSVRKLVKRFPFDPQGRYKNKFDRWLDLLQEALASGTRDRVFFCRQSLLSLAIWLLFPFKAYFIASSLGMEVGFFHLAVATYLAYMAGMIPLLPGGLGTFEGSMVLLLVPAGIPLHQGMVLALVFRFVTFWLVFLVSACYLGFYTMFAGRKKLHISLDGRIARDYLTRDVEMEEKWKDLGPPQCFRIQEMNRECHTVKTK